MIGTPQNPIKNTQGPLSLLASGAACEVTLEEAREKSAMLAEAGVEESIRNCGF